MPLAFRLLFAVILLLMALLWVLGGVFAIIKDKNRTIVHLLLRCIFAGLLICGGISFFGQGFLSLVGRYLLGPYLEWPVGLSSGVVQDRQGHYIVPLCPINRIQVYDSSREFLRGWCIDGSLLEVRIEGEYIEAFAKGSRRLLYLPDGQLVKDGYWTADTRPAREQSDVFYFPTPFYLWPFTGPFLGWLTAMLGMIGMICLDKTWKQDRVQKVKVIASNIYGYCPHCDAGLSPEEAYVAGASVRCPGCRAALSLGSLLRNAGAGDLRCPHCHAVVATARLARPSRPARCPHCGGGFSFFGDSAAQVLAVPISGATSATGSTRLTVGWFRMGGSGTRVFGLAFLCFWDMALITTFLQSPPHHLQDWGVVTGLGALSLTLTYWLLASVCNRTTISLSNQRLRIHHGPVPWPGVHWLDLRTIEGLALEETYGAFRPDRTKPAYVVSAVVAGRGCVKLIGGSFSGAFAREADAALCRLQIHQMLSSG
jgi:hypothetical protein